MRGQIFSMDFAASLLLFTLGIILAYSMITNNFMNEDAKIVTRQAENAAAIISGTGYPDQYINDTVIRAGLSSAGKLSLRKATEISKLSTNEVRATLRLTDNFYLYLRNSTNETVPIFESCGIGDVSVSEIANEMNLTAVSLAPASSPLSDRTAATIYSDALGIKEARQADFIIIEGDLTQLTDDTQEHLRLDLERISLRGVTIVVAGYPGTDVLGMSTSLVNTTQLNVQGDMGLDLNLSAGEILNVSTAGEKEIRVIDSVEDAVDYTVVATSDGSEAAFVSYIYSGAKIWYLATVDGEREDGSDLATELGDAIQDMIAVQRPQCGNLSVPASAEQVAVSKRVLGHRDDPLTIEVVVWR